MNAKQNIEAIYGLSPLQHGMLHHSAMDPNSGVYTTQQVFAIAGDLNLEAFERAWNEVVRRHGTFRTMFLRIESKKPVQVIRKTAPLPWRFLDWRTKAPALQQRLFNDLVAKDRLRGFTLTAAPLMRLELVCLAENDFRLVWSQHHAITDGWTNALVLKEVLLLYNSFCQEKTLELPRPRPFRDYISWLDANDAAEAERFWREELAGHEEPTPLGIDHASQSEDASQSQLTLDFSEDETAKILQLTQAGGLTPNILAQGVWASILSTYSGRREVIFGATVSGRPPSLTGVETMVGPFINTVPVCIAMDGNKTVLEWLQELHQKQIRRLRFDYTPLVTLRQWAAIPGDRPLFESLVVFENYPLDEALGNLAQGLSIKPVEGFSPNNLPLTLRMTLKGSKLSVHFIYENRRFHGETIANLTRHYHHALLQLVAHPSGKLSQYGGLIAAASQMPVAGGQTVDDLRCVHQWVDHFAAQRPDSLACIMGSQRLSYAQLANRASACARVLMARGIGRESLVGLWSERSPQMLVAMLAILKAGGAFVPIAPDTPPKRLRQLIEESSMKWVLSPSANTGAMASTGPEFLALDQPWIDLAASTTPRDLPQCDLDQLAYVIFTSGSTGRPKGVGISHRAIVNYAKGLVQPWNLAPTAQLATLATAAADLGHTAVFGALVNGTILRLFDESLNLNPSGLAEELRTQPVDGVKLVPSHLSTLLAGGDREAASILPKQWLILGGEAPDGTLIARVGQLAPACRIMNHYGPTETTVGALTFRIEGATRNKGERIPIGKPLPGYTAAIMDPWLRPLPSGIKGELTIGGTGLARCYMGRPGATAERFVPDPFGTRPGERLYRTGDTARAESSGDLLFLGRLDHQIKIRGFRIELGEIEAAILKLPQIRQAVVVVAGASLNRHLCAWVVTREKTELTAEDLLVPLRESLPDAMVPARLFFLESLPLTANGKVDRTALVNKAIMEDPQNEAPSWDPSNHPVEGFLQNLWRDILELEQVGRNESFFSLGGNSLLATLVLTRARAQFKLDLAIRDLFEAPSIGEFAARIASLQSEAKSGPAFQLVDRTSRHPLSFAQQRLWFLEQLEEGEANYNVFGALRITGNLNIPALERSLALLADRHEMLRTVFPDSEGDPYQKILATTPPLLQRTSLDEANLEDHLQREMTHRFDLSQAPMLRTVLAQISEDVYVFTLCMHHIISDRWSIGVMIKEMMAHYAANLVPAEKPLPELPFQYVDFAHWQRQHLSGKELNRQLDFWKARLAGHPPLLALPTDKPRPSHQSFQGDEVPFRFSSDLVSSLNQLSEACKVTPFMTLLAALNVLLYRLSGQNDILVGCPVANRNRRETEALIGFFVNTLVLRNQPRGEQPFADFMAAVRDATLDAYQYQDTPFELIVDALQPERNLSHAPIFQVMLVYQNVPSTAMQAPGLRVTPLKQPTSTAKFDLTFIVSDAEGKLEGSVQFGTDLFQRSTVARMVQQWQSILAEVVGNPRSKIGTISLLAPEQRQQILQVSNGAGSSPAAELTAHRMFERWAKLKEEAIALVFDDQPMSYKTVNERTNQMAHQMISRGIGPETAVGLYAHAPFELIIGMMAILKAGATYVPLDPNYPATRTAAMIADADIQWVLTTRTLVSGLPATTATALLLDSKEACTAPTTNPDVALDMAWAAYLIFTSGSTGRPKAVVVSHKNLASSTGVRMEFYGSLAECFLLLSSPAFDSSIAGLFGTLCGGGRLVFGDPREDPHAILQRIRSWKVTQTLCLPSLYGALLDLVDKEPWPLRSVIVAGEACTLPLLQKHQRKAPNTHLFNEYGPTEGSVWCSVWKLPAALPKTTVPIGKPLAGTATYVMDGRGQLQPLGVLGELYLGGWGLARGYLGRAAATAEKFVPNPFGGPGQRLYRTGDWVRQEADGQLMFMGRVDHQVKLRGFRVEPEEIESILGAVSGIRDNAVVLVKMPSRAAQLVAFCVMVDGSHPPSISTLRGQLEKELPDHMIPSRFLFLETLPQTGNGKVDRTALRAKAPEMLRATSTIQGDESNPSAAEFEKPRTKVERQLAVIWEEMLGLEKVGIHDNFFQLGGDSILAIQVIARANRARYGLTPKHLFEHQTIARLATAVKVGHATIGENETVQGPVPLSPIQHWFFELGLSQGYHWNQSVLLKIDDHFDPDAFSAAVASLLAHHDALRARFQWNDEGLKSNNVGVVQDFAATGNAPTIETFDLSQCPPSDLDSELQENIAQVQGSMKLDQEPLIRIAEFNLGPDRGSRLLIAVHHLIVDGVSWRILLEDLTSAYEAAHQNRPITLPQKTTSYATWVGRLRAYANTHQVAEEKAYWLQLARETVPKLPLDDHGPNLVASERSLTVTLDQAQTQFVLKDIHHAYRTEINDVLLTALLAAFNQWAGATALYLSLEGHGREPLFEELDLSRTVGWFTAEYPILLQWDGQRSMGRQLMAIKERLRNVPQRGLSFGLLRYLSNDPNIREQLKAMPKPAISFNYLGQFFDDPHAEGAFQMAQEAPGANHGQAQERPVQLAITGLVDRGGRLTFHWNYSANLHQNSTIQKLAVAFRQNLVDLATHCKHPEAGGRTPSDFPEAGLDQSQIDHLVKTIGDSENAARNGATLIESIYPLSAQQHGMIFHTLIQPKSDVYLWQLACEFRGLDPQAFKRAWQQVADHHDNLRTCFWNYRSSEPLQVVVKNVTLPWVKLDCQDVDEASIENRFAALLAEPQYRSFDFSSAPILKLVLIHMGKGIYRFIWAQHHALSDGWSQPLILKHLFDAYAAALSGKTWQPPATRPFRDYIRWLLNQDMERGLAYWRQRLNGSSQPTALGIENEAPGSSDSSLGECSLTLEEEASARLNRLVREQALTTNAVVQGMWAILLGRYSGKQDVLYGTISSGRPGELAGIETMVGSFVSALPVRITMENEAPVLAWLKDLLSHQFQREQFGFVPLVDIQRCSEVPRGKPFFQLLVQSQNYPNIEGLSASGLDIKILSTFEKNNYPLTLKIVEGRQLLLEITYDPALFQIAAIQKLLTPFETITGGFHQPPRQDSGRLGHAHGRGAKAKSKAKK